MLAAGAVPIRVDVLDRSALLRALDGHRREAVIAQLTALKKAPTGHKDMAATNRLRTEGTVNLLAAAKQIGASRFVTQSMVFGYGYGDFHGRVLTESDRFAPPRARPVPGAPRGDARQREPGARPTHVEGIALRYGLLYGPDRPATGWLRGCADDVCR